MSGFTLGVQCLGFGGFLLSLLLFPARCLSAISFNKINISKEAAIHVISLILAFANSECERFLTAYH